MHVGTMLKGRTLDALAQEPVGKAFSIRACGMRLLRRKE